METKNTIYYHDGYVESCHPKTDNQWYIEKGNYSKEFCDNLKDGSFIPCGNSGRKTWYPPIDYNYKTLNKGIYLDNSVECCCFVFGTSCTNSQLSRRWTCCGQTKTCKFDEMLLIKGCKKKKNCHSS